MSWEREYIVQTYENAANNLRMTSRRLVNHTLFKEFLSECENLEKAIDEMKKITELAKFAIKLGKVYEYTQSPPEFIKLTEVMSRQINELIPEVREILDEYEPEYISGKLNSIQAVLNNDVSAQANDDTTENIIEVVGLIKKVDDYLNLCVTGEISGDDKEKFMEIVNRKNSLLHNFSDPLVNEMREIFNELFGNIISNGVSQPEEVEAMRACLIVIVAKLKNKDVDVSQFIELARNVAVRKEEE